MVARRWRKVFVASTMAVALAGAVSYGVAQQSVVTQAEWAVYMVQALDLDWNLPKTAKTRDYMARLNWTGSIEFDASHTLPGSSPSLVPESGGDGVTLKATDASAEALYRVATLQPGDYNLRVKMAGGSALFKVNDAVFEIDQPSTELKWVDMERVSLDAGPQQLSLLVGGGARIQSLAITPPCLRPVEPSGGWQALAPLRFGEMAVSIAKALNLETELPGLGPAVVLPGESFSRDFELETGADGDAPEGAKDPFWLSAGSSLVNGRVRFTVPSDGLYSFEARYLSPKNPVRWVLDRCVKIVTCEKSAEDGLRWTPVTALELTAGEHEVEITLPPQARLDRVTVQRRDASLEEYIRVVEDAGIAMGSPADLVKRRQAVNAAQRLRAIFRKQLSSTCHDLLLAMEQRAALRAAQKSASVPQPVEERTARSQGTPGDYGDPLFPRGSLDTSTSESSPITPGPPR